MENTLSLKNLTFGDLVQLALKQPGFFGGLKTDPAKTLTEAGYEPTPLVLAALSKVCYDDIQNLFRACDPTTGPMC